MKPLYIRANERKALIPYSQERRPGMAQTFDLLLRGATVVNHDGEGQRDIGVSEGKVAAIGSLGRASAGEIIDATGLHILPGVIDSQVHFREPGATHKEDLETGSLAAVMGGVTAVFEMPNTNPLTTSAKAIACTATLRSLWEARARIRRIWGNWSFCRAVPG
jgi:urease alpha subunit